MYCMRERNLMRILDLVILNYGSAVMAAVKFRVIQGY